MFVNTTGDAVFDGTLRQGLAVQLEQLSFQVNLSQRFTAALAEPSSTPSATAPSQVGVTPLQMVGAVSSVANGGEMIEVYLAAAQAGWYLTPINHHLTAGENIADMGGVTLPAFLPATAHDLGQAQGLRVFLGGFEGHHGDGELEPARGRNDELVYRRPGRQQIRHPPLQ